MGGSLIDFEEGGDALPLDGGNAPAVTVSELAGRVKRMVEDAFGRVRVRGELGRVSRPSSGHIYVDLKDDRAVLAAVIWKAQVKALGVKPEEGLEVIAEGRLTTYPGQSKYQLVIESLTPAGAGALMAMLEERKKRLAAEGLFDAARKKTPPYLPSVIGVVTSPSGAVIRDILHRLRDRFPTRVLIWPVAVQGEACAGEVARAIHGFNALRPDGAVPRPDVIIVARGGGSIEDLWGFNDEAVARAAAASDIPLISAVGHETDTTLIDHAADLRAPTPTAAAEMATPVRSELAARLATLEARRLGAMARAGAERRRRLRDLARALPRVDGLLGPARQRFDAASARLPMALRSGVRALDARLARVAARVSPRLLTARLDQGRERLRGLGLRLHPSLRRGVALAARDFARAGFARRLARAADEAAAARRERLGRIGRLFESLSYKATLERGYAAVRGGSGVVARAAQVTAGDALTLEFADGAVAVTAGEGAGPARPPRRKAPPPPSDGGGDQGALF